MTQICLTNHDLVWSVGEEMVQTTSTQSNSVLSIIYSLVRNPKLVDEISYFLFYILSKIVLEKQAAHTA